MPQLKLPTLPIRIHIIRHRRPARPDRLRQHAMNGLIQRLHFTLAQFRSQPPRMNLRAPQTLIRINIPHPAKHALVHQQRLDLCAPACDRLPKILLAHLQRIESQPANQRLALPIEQNSDPPKSPNIRVTKLAPIIQRKKEMRMRRNGSFRRSHHDLPGHAQVHQQRNFPAVFSAVPPRSSPMTMNFPNRSMPVTRVPGNSLSSDAGSSIKSVFALKRTPVIRRPGNTSRKPRTTVSTSGNSGISYTKVAHTNPDAAAPSRCARLPPF